MDFLNKKRADNICQVPQYYVEDSHLAIIDKEMWEAVQLEMERRRRFALCGSYGQVFGRKVWNSTDERLRRIIWRCNGKYPIKGEKGCDSKHIDNEVLYQAFIDTFNVLIKNNDYFVSKWQERL